MCINNWIKKVVHWLIKAIYLFEYQTIKYTNNFKANWNKILEVLKSITEKEQFLKHDNGKTLDIVVKTLEELNYTIFYKVLNRSKFGLSQNRERVYIVGFNNNNFQNIEFKFPNPNITSCLDEVLEKEPRSLAR